jgi:hypothetical protein
VTQLRGPTAFYDVATLLVDGVRDALAASLGGPVQRACVVPGDIAWDACDCGLLAVSPQRFFLADDFPTGTLGTSGRTTPCDAPWLVGELVINVVRCAPTPQGTSVSIPRDQLDAAGQVTAADAYVTLTETVSVLCGLVEDERIVDYLLGEQVTSGPQGDCVGTELRASVAVYR